MKKGNDIVSIFNDRDYPVRSKEAACMRFELLKNLLQSGHIGEQR